jgi:HEAT repeat protein
MTNPRQLLDAVIERGSESDLAAWAVSGRDGLLLLRAAILGRGSWDGVHPKDVIDGLTAASAAIAAQQPTAFLEVFADPRFDENGWVLTGLGHIDDDRATERLASAAGAQSSWTRMDAAIGLGRRPVAKAVDALIPLLDDPEYLVRYHALRSLGAVGGARAADALRAFQAPSTHERQLADGAISEIERRLGDADGGG